MGKNEEDRNPWVRGCKFWYMRNLEEAIKGTDNHKSCWDCEWLQVAGQPNRRCKIHQEQFIFQANAEDELSHYSDDGKTMADKCSDYLDCKEMRTDKHKTITMTKEDAVAMTDSERKALNVLRFDNEDGIFTLVCWDSSED